MNGNLFEQIHAKPVTNYRRSLRKKETVWIWTIDQQKALNNIKELLTTPPLLKYYNVNEDVTISVDASSTAVRMVLLQGDHPIAYAIKELTVTQQAYSRIEKETLTVKLGCQKFHQHLIYKKLVIERDHKPLQFIFFKSIDLAPPRLKRIM